MTLHLLRLSVTLNVVLAACGPPLPAGGVAVAADESSARRHGPTAPERGSVRLYVDRLALHPEVRALQLVAARVDFVYASAAKHGAGAGNEQRCTSRQAVTVANRIVLDVPLRSTGLLFLEQLRAPVGEVSEIRLLLAAGTASVGACDAELTTSARCGEARKQQLVRILPKDGAPFSITTSAPIGVAVELDAVRDLSVRPALATSAAQRGDDDDDDDDGRGRGDDDGADPSHHDDDDDDDDDRPNGPGRCGTSVELASELAGRLLPEGVSGAGTVNAFRDPIAGAYLVRFADGLTPAEVAALADQLLLDFGGTRSALFSGPVVPAAHVEGWSPEAARAAAFHPSVLYVDQGAFARYTSTQSLRLAAGLSSNKDLDRIDQRENQLDLRFRRVHRGRDILIYIVDSGVDTNRTSYALRFDNGNSFGVPGVAGAAFPTFDQNGHGTAMASLAAGEFGTGDRATLLAVKISAMGAPKIMDLETAMRTLLTREAGVINLSLAAQTTGTTTMLDELTRQLVAAGHVVVAAAGNDGADTNSFTPARITEALTVAAMDVGSHSRWVNVNTGSSSNFGTAVDLFAPGAEVRVEVPGGGSGTERGTSPAAALTSGGAAMLWESERTLNPAQLASKLTAAATPNLLSDVRGAPNRLLFTDVQPSVLGSRSIGRGQSILCSVGVGVPVPLVTTVTAAVTDEPGGALYVAYKETPPPFCVSTNPFADPATLFIERQASDNGLVIWRRQVGAGLAIAEHIHHLTIGPGGDVFAVGTTIGGPGGTFDARALRLRRFDGQVLWDVLVDSGADDFGGGITTSFFGASVVVSGSTRGAFQGVSSGGLDMFVVFVSAAGGTLDQTSPAAFIQFGSSGDDLARDVARVGNVIAVGGSTTGSLGGMPEGGTDAVLAFVREPDPVVGGPPQPLIVRQALQFGTPGNDALTAVSSADEVLLSGATATVLFAAGETDGAFPGQLNRGGVDIFHARFEQPSGADFGRVWLHQTGTASNESAPHLTFGPDDVFIGAGSYLLKASRVSGFEAWRQPTTGARTVVATDRLEHVLTLGTAVERYLGF